MRRRERREGRVVEGEERVAVMVLRCWVVGLGHWCGCCQHRDGFHMLCSGSLVILADQGISVRWICSGLRYRHCNGDESERHVGREQQGHVSAGFEIVASW